jgi:hypothetical protein
MLAEATLFEKKWNQKEFNNILDIPNQTVFLQTLPNSLADIGKRKCIVKNVKILKFEP